MEKKLMRSNSNKVIGGVCGGIGEYFDIDPVFIRIIAVLLVLGFHGVGGVAYIVAMIIMPKKEPEFMTNENGQSVQVEEVQKEYSTWNKYLPGMILICIGLILLIRENIYWFSWDEFWPLALILGGLYLIFRRKNKAEDDVVEPTVEVHNGQTKSENGGSTV